MQTLLTSLVIAVPVLIVLELLIGYLKRLGSYEKKDTKVNLLTAIINLGPNMLFKSAAFVMFLYLSQYSFITYPKWWMSWVVAYFMFEFIGYWMHRWFHTFQLLWAVHIVHHSSVEYNFSVALRTNMLQYLLHFLHFPAMFLGIEPWQFFAIYYTTNFVTLLLHTRIVSGNRMAEYIFVTPRLHQIHHGCNEKYLDKNYGYTLIIFDRLFGTFEPYSEPIKIGITTGRTSNKYFRVQLDELVRTIKGFRQMEGWKTKLSFLFARPVEANNMIEASQAAVQMSSKIEKKRRSKLPKTLGFMNNKALQSYKTIQNYGHKLLNETESTKQKQTGENTLNKVKMLMILVSGCFAIQGQNIEMMMHQAETYTTNWEEQKALDMYTSVLKLDYSNTKALEQMCWLATCLAGRDMDQTNSMQKLEGILHLLEGAIIKHDKSPALLFNHLIVLGLISEREKGAKQKVKYCREIRQGAENLIALAPDHPGGYFVLGKWNWVVSNLSWIEVSAINLLFGGIPGEASVQKAKVLINKAIKLSPECIQFYLDLARIHVEQNEIPKAKQLLEKAILLKPLCLDDTIRISKCKELMAAVLEE